jgi:hypothetical protein
MDLPEHGALLLLKPQLSGTTTYTFTPTDPCAAVTKMDIVISTQITPTFTAVAPICSWSNTCCITDNIEQWYHGYMDSGAQ